VIQVLASLATHALALVVYPGFVTVAVFGGLVEMVWTRLTQGAWPPLPRQRPTVVISTVVLSVILAAVEMAAPFNPVPAEERSVVIAAMALSFTLWAELALSVEVVDAPGLRLIVQVVWLLAVLGPAVQPETLRPQALGNVLVPELLPVKVASGFLYLLCLPALLRLWPLGPVTERRQGPRLNVVRGLCWFGYCGLFTTLFFPPSNDDLLGLLRFFGITLLVAVVMVGAGLWVRRGEAAIARGFYARLVLPYAALVLLLVIGTSFLVR
jgi:hypothetical protein